MYTRNGPQRLRAAPETQPLADAELGTDRIINGVSHDGGALYVPSVAPSVTCISCGAHPQIEGWAPTDWGLAMPVADAMIGRREATRMRGGHEPLAISEHAKFAMSA